jgi:hypothetical protein
MSAATGALERLLAALGIPAEAGVGWPEAFLVGVSVALSLSVFLSRDTHGYITVGYRTPFQRLPAHARWRIYLAIAVGLYAAGVVVSKLSSSAA